MTKMPHSSLPAYNWSRFERSRMCSRPETKDAEEAFVRRVLCMFGAVSVVRLLEFSNNYNNEASASVSPLISTFKSTLLK